MDPVLQGIFSKLFIWQIGTLTPKSSYIESELKYLLDTLPAVAWPQFIRATRSIVPGPLPFVRLVPAGTTSATIEEFQ
jgi:hypothetical protein